MTDYSFMKYTFVCDPDECDALIEFTCRNVFDFPNGVVAMKCPCGRNLNWISSEQVKDEKNMENTLEQQMAEAEKRDQELKRSQQEILAERFAPSTTIVYKDFDGQSVEFKEMTAGDLHYVVSDRKRYSKLANSLSLQIDAIKSNLAMDEWYSDSVDKDEVLSQLCEILDYNPTVTITFAGRMSFDGEVELTMEEAQDFDLESYLSDELSLDTMNGAITISSYDIDWISEE